MPLPIVPIAMIAGAYALARNVSICPVDQRFEDRLNDVEEGLSVRRDQENSQINTSYRWKRTIRFGTHGPGLEVDATALGRLMVKTVN